LAGSQPAAAVAGFGACESTPNIPFPSLAFAAGNFVPNMLCAKADSLVAHE